MKKILFPLIATIPAIFGFAQNHDLNGDGEVNSSDVVALYNSIASGASSEGGNISNQTIKIDNLGLTVSFNMIAVKGGTFQMGATSEQQDPYETEKPVHQVTLSNYYIGETEVTQELWATVMGNNPSAYNGINNPVEYVSWDDCQEFIEKLNTLTGKKFRLPTEAEWEYAARGGNKSKGYQYSGSNKLDDVAWYWKNSGDSYLSGTDDDWDADIVLENNPIHHPVKSKRANELGIYDMSGNVSEWCQDWAEYYSTSSQFNPQGPDDGIERIIRGGDFIRRGWLCRSACRGFLEPEEYYTNQGFRLALSEADATQKYDLNSDGVVNSSDVVALYNYIALSGSSGGSISRQTININNFGIEVSFNMIAVNGGTFQMGATPEQQNSFDHEKPVHQVTLTNYFIGETEVTQALWTAVMGSNPSATKDNNNPVECVSWEDCQEFITKLNNLTKLKFRLPTEAEWEFAARGGNKSKGYQYSGSNNLDDVAWYWKNSGDSYLSGTDDDWNADIINENNLRPRPVKTKNANELGIYDMSGNVAEWCQDWAVSYRSNSQINPKETFSGLYRIFRGGDSFKPGLCCRSAFRESETPDSVYRNIGFRLALSE